ncbi:MAG: pseudouridine synthase, partial [bacterium]
MSPQTDRRELTVTGEAGRRTTPEPGERIDRFLGRQFEDLSRSRVEQLIDEGSVTVDGTVPKRSMKARPGQRVVLEVPPPVEPSAEPQQIPLDIIYEDEHLVVVDKEPGMVVHPAPGHPDGTLVNALLHHCGDLSGIGGVLRPGIVHRLDKDTSGLLAAAKTQQAHIGLASQLKEREMGRRYLGLVWGHPDPE